MRIRKKCKFCGKTIFVLPSRVRYGVGKYCSRKCFYKDLSDKKIKRIKRKCLICGKIFYVLPSATKRGRYKFCSKGCYYKWLSSEQNRGKKNPHWKSVERICPVCKKIFYVYPSNLKAGGGKFCSNKCRGKWQSINGTGKNGSHWQGGEIEMKCLSCGKSFFVRHYRAKRDETKFCSGSCRAIYGVKHHKFKRTSIELKTEKMLKQLNIEYEEQKMIPEAHTAADFYIPEQRLVIYADGTFWHKSEWAKKNGIIDKDGNQDFLLAFNGYKVLRLSEDEINLHPRRCLTRIKKLSAGV